MPRCAVLAAHRGELTSTLVASAKYARGQRDDSHQGGDHAERRRERRRRGDAADHPRCDEAARVRDDGDACNAARGMGAHPPRRREHERDDDGKPDPEQCEARQPTARPGASTTAMAPTKAHAPEMRTVRTSPSLRITRSPMSLTVAIATANAETASAATFADPPSSLRI